MLHLPFVVGLEQDGADEADDLELFGGRVSHARSSPSAIMFFEQAEFKRLLGDDFLQRAGLLAQRLHLIAGGRAGGVTGQAALTVRRSA